MADVKISALPVADSINPLIRCGLQLGQTVQIPGAADLAQTARDLGYTPGPINIPINVQSAAYTTVLADQGKCILHPSADTTARTWTIDSNANVSYLLGTVLTFVNQNGAGAITLAITADTMRLAGSGATGNRTIASNGICSAIKLTATEWLVSGTGLT